MPPGDASRRGLHMISRGPHRIWAVFCFGTVAFLVYRDLFVESAREVEVFFGLELHGRAARATAPLHWLVFGLGGIGFWRAWPSIVPLAAGYAFYVAFGHLVWNLTSPQGAGWVAGLLQAMLFSLPGLALLYLPPVPMPSDARNEGAEALRPPE